MTNLTIAASTNEAKSQMRPKAAMTTKRERERQTDRVNERELVAAQSDGGRVCQSV